MRAGLAQAAGDYFRQQGYTKGLQWTEAGPVRRNRRAARRIRSRAASGAAARDDRAAQSPGDAVSPTNRANAERFQSEQVLADKFYEEKRLFSSKADICQKLPEEYEEKLHSFQRFVLSLRRRHGYHLGQFGNTDQTPLYFDMPATTTVEKKGAKQVRVLSSGHEKTRVTAMLCCTADGHKLPPYLIFRRKTLPKGIVFPSGVIVRANEKGWMTTDLVADWIDHVWRKRPGGSLGLRAMLVLDAFRCHLDQRIKDKLAACNTDLVVIPGGMTSQLQPLDVCLNKPVKDRIRALYTEWLVSGCHEFTPSNRMKRATLQDFTGWAKDAWSTIPSAMVSKAFKKCGISNSMDGTEDEMLWSVDSDKELSDSDDE